MIKSNPFFIYYPMLLVHDPFVPTPDIRITATPETPVPDDSAYIVITIIMVLY